MKPYGPVLISANTFWNIKNFRAGLIRAVSGAGFRTLIATPDPDFEWVKRYDAEAIEVRIDRSGLNPITDFRLFLAYLRLFRQHRPRYFLGFTIKPNIYGGLAARIAGVSSIPNISGLGTAFMANGPLNEFVSILYRIALRRSPTVFFQNPDDLGHFVEKGIVTSSQARLLPGSGVDLNHFKPAKMPLSPSPIFLFVGRLLADKGVREFVAAARRILAIHPDWRFQLSGPIDTDNRSAIGQAELDGWRREGVVEYLGFHDDVRPMIEAATAVVLPSYYREGVPRALLEAAAMARPLVAANVRGSRQIVEHGVNGLLCEARSEHSLADALMAIGQMPREELEAFGKASRAKVEREFGEERVIAAYFEALQATPSMEAELSGRD